MLYTTNISYNAFLLKLKKYENKHNVFVTLRGKYKNEKMIISAIYNDSYIPIKKSYLISFNTDHSIKVSKVSLVDYIFLVLFGILFALLAVSMIFWYHINLLYITLFVVGGSMIPLIVSIVTYKQFIIKTLKDDFGFIPIKKR